MRWKYQGALDDLTRITAPNNRAVGVPAYATWDMFGSIKLLKRFELRAGVNNLFHRGLPFVASNQTGTDTALYDLVGRSFYIGLKASF